jgi:hypothetical protein
MTHRKVCASLLAALGSLALLVAGCSTTAGPATFPGGVPEQTTVEPVPTAKRAAKPFVPPTRLPPQLPTVFRPTCDNAPAGWLARELTQREVTNLPAATAMSPRGSSSAFGYLDRTFATCGQPVGLHLSAAHAMSVTIEALRLGYYAGHLARVVWRSGPVHVDRGSYTPSTGRTTEVDHWRTSVVIRPTADWPPGLYALRITPAGAGSPTFVPLRILSSGTRSPFLAISSDLTELAYNSWGGTSLYYGRPTVSQDLRAARAFVASAHRPAFRTSTVQYLTMDVSLATFADHHGITLDWTTDSALDADPTQVQGRSALIVPGHSEYWTTRTYDTLEVAVNAGTNLLVLGANELYWHARLTRDAIGDVTSMTVVRDATQDVGVAPADKTVLWAGAPLNRDGARLTGVHTSAVGILTDGSVVATAAWLFAGTGLKPGAQVRRVFGNEGDGPEVPVPARLQVLISVHTVDRGRRHSYVTTAYFAAPSGAGVFDAGSTEWLCSITNTCYDGPRPTATSRALDFVTLNALKAFVRPRFGVTHPVARAAA